MKYIKPRSVTWWTGVANLVAGVFIAFEPVHGQSAVADSFRALFGNASPGMLMTAGFGLIGLRAAV